MNPKGCNRENDKVIYEVTEMGKIVGQRKLLDWN